MRPRALAALVAALLAGLALAPGAGAANRRVAIGDFRWSLPVVNIDLGEHVTWHWVGPDTIHSVTGISANDQNWDSDPTTSLPKHPLGDSYRLEFDTPGIYQFECKLHPFVNGEVVVSANPGNPVDEPDPVPEINFDLKAPIVGSLRLDGNTFGHGGTGMHFALDERTVVDAEYYRLKPRGGGRSYAGWAQWTGYVGYNDVRFGAPRKHFRARPGRYVAFIRGTDLSANESKPKKRRFRILAPRR